MSVGLQLLRELDFPDAENKGNGCTDAVEYGNYLKGSVIIASRTLTNADISVVAVHGLHEDPVSAWTEPESGTLWLRDLVPLHIPKARVLSFGYESSPSLYNVEHVMEKIQSVATTLVADLEGDRSLENCERRPIIFICHGLGGVVVKKALVQSASSTSSHVAHLNDIFVSTFAILLFGTPHEQLNIANWLLQESPTGTSIGDRRRKHSQPAPRAKLLSLETIANEFAPLMKKFHTTFFWEGMPTDLGGYVDFFVDQASAAPVIYDAPKCGIIGATHSQMVKFTKLSPSYRTVLSTLKRYCRMSPNIISHRWKEADDAMTRARVNEAQELTDFRFALPDKLPDLSISDFPREETRNQHFFTRMLYSDIYIGRMDVYKSIRKAFLLGNASFAMQDQKRFVVHGIPGSGKSQLCTN